MPLSPSVCITDGPMWGCRPSGRRTLIDCCTRAPSQTGNLSNRCLWADRFTSAYLCSYNSGNVRASTGRFAQRTRWAADALLRRGHRLLLTCPNRPSPRKTSAPVFDFRPDLLRLKRECMSDEQRSLPSPAFTPLHCSPADLPLPELTWTPSNVKCLHRFTSPLMVNLFNGTRNRESGARPRFFSSVS